MQKSSLQIANEFGLLDETADWMFYDYLLHSENPIFQCGKCNELSFVPDKTCPKCGTKMYIPESAIRYLPEKYRHICKG